MKKLLITILLLSFLLISCNKNVNPLEYSTVSTIAGKVTYSGSDSDDFEIQVTKNFSDPDTIWIERYENASGRYSFYLNVQGTYQIAVIVYTNSIIADSDIKTGQQLTIGSITEVNFDL